MGGRMSGTRGPRLKRVGALLAPGGRARCLRPAADRGGLVTPAHGRPADPLVQRLPRAPAAAGRRRRDPVTASGTPDDVRPGASSTSPPTLAAPPGPRELADRRRRRPDRRHAVPVGPLQGRARVETLNTLGLDVSRRRQPRVRRGRPRAAADAVRRLPPDRGLLRRRRVLRARFRYLAANVTYKDGVTRRTPAGAPRYGVWFGTRPAAPCCRRPRSRRSAASRSASSG